MEMASPASFPHGMPCQLPWLLNLADVEGRCHAPAVGRVGCIVLGVICCLVPSDRVFLPPKGISQWQESCLPLYWPDLMLLSSRLSALLSVGFFVVVGFFGVGGGFFVPSPTAFWHLPPFPPSLGSSAVSVCDHWHVLWKFGENGGSLWNVWSLLSCQVGCCTGRHLDGSCLHFRWTLGEPRDWFGSQASWEALLLHPLPREDESHPVSLSWWDAGNVLGAILAMPFRSVDGGSVFCEAEGSSTVISSRGLVSKHTSVLRR